MHTIMCETFSPSLRNRMKTMMPSRRTPETDRTMTAPHSRRVGPRTDVSARHVVPSGTPWGRRRDENGWHVHRRFFRGGRVPKTRKRVALSGWSLVRQSAAVGKLEKFHRKENVRQRLFG